MKKINKHRGKHKSTPYFHHLKGTSHHKICIVAATDEHDQMLFKIGGLGRESFKILIQHKTSAGISGLGRIQEETEYTLDMRKWKPETYMESIIE